MTQEVQPLTWQKRTNIEEHQQFFSKINEIIGNLAPTVDEAEQAIAQATAAIASANDAAATANAASAAASAAASQAQTAASTVADYNTRLIAVEDESAGNTANITDLQDRMGTAEGKITALQNVQPDYLKKAGAAQTVTSQIMVPTTATGLRDTQIANGTRIQNDLDAYAPMVRTTGNQTKTGNLTFTGSVISKRAQNNPHLTMINDNIASVDDMNTAWSYPIIFRAENNDELGHLTFGRNGSGKSYLTLTLVASDGTNKTITLGVND